MITFDNASTTTGNGASARTISFTTSGNNRFLFVAGIFPTTVLPTIIPSVTYNSVALSAFFNTALNAAAGYYYQSWYLSAPAAGANNLVITPFDASHSLGATTSLFTIASYAGVRQSSPIEQMISNTTGPLLLDTQTASITTSADNAWGLGSMITNGTSPTFTASTGTVRTQVTGAGLPSSICHIDNGPISPGGSSGATVTTTPAGTFTGGKYWISVAESIAPEPDNFIPQVMFF